MFNVEELKDDSVSYCGIAENTLVECHVSFMSSFGYSEVSKVSIHTTSNGKKGASSTEVPHCATGTWQCKLPQ